MATPTDEASIVARLRSGDEQAFASIVESWSGGMIRLARNYVSTHDSALEVVQETWLAVIAGLARFEGRSTLKTWVYRILINTAQRRGRSESNSTPMSSLGITDDDSGPTVDPDRFRKPGEPYAHHWQEFPVPWPSPEDSTLSSELRDLIAQAVDTLPVRQRIVITLRDIEGCDSDEVCELLDITPANQRVLLHRARAAIRAAIEDYVESEGRRRD